MNSPEQTNPYKKKDQWLHRAGKENIEGES